MNLYEKMTGRKGMLVFARLGGWAAYFNSYDISGDPEAIIYDLGDRNDDGNAVESLDKWLELAKKGVWR